MSALNSGLPLVDEWWMSVASPRVLLACEKAGIAAYRAGLRRVDNPYTAKISRSPPLDESDRLLLAAAWFEGWDKAEGLARGSDPLA